MASVNFTTIQLYRSSKIKRKCVATDGRHKKALSVDISLQAVSARNTCYVLRESATYINSQNCFLFTYIPTYILVFQERIHEEL